MKRSPLKCRNRVAQDLLAILNRADPGSLVDPAVMLWGMSSKHLALQLHEQGILSESGLRCRPSPQPAGPDEDPSASAADLLPRVDHSPRVYGSGFVNLSRPVRDELYRLMGWHSFDFSRTLSSPSWENLERPVHSSVS